MRTRSALILGLVLLFGTTTLAQDYAKVEVPVGYSYIRFNPENSDIVSGFSLNGRNGFTKGNQNQSNFRYQAGIVFRF